jgi:Xaa-Pro aminopeptidase
VRGGREIIAAMHPDCRHTCLPFLAHAGKGFRLPVLALLIALLPAAAVGQTCDIQPTQAQMVQANFQRIAKEGDFASAQDYAERARRGLDQLGAQARRCGCESAQTGFEDAAREMRKTRLAESRAALRQVAERASAAFEAAMVLQRVCGGS